MDAILEPMGNRKISRKDKRTAQLEDRAPKSPQVCTNCGKRRNIRFWRWVAKHEWQMFCKDCTNKIEPGVLVG